MKIALVHDHLISFGGGERVLKVLSDMYPTAPIYTFVYRKNKTYSFFADKNIKKSFINYIPFSASKYQWTLPLRPLAIESVDLSDYDLIISCSSSIAKGIVKKGSAVHINYCHTPTRFLWVDDKEYVDSLERVWPVNILSQLYRERLKIWDIKASERVDYFIANSENVKKRIKRIYNRESEVIYPPVDVDMFHISSDLGDYFLTGGRMVPYKKFDIVIKAFNKLKMPLKIFGTGPMYRYLKSIAERNIEFLGNITEREKINLFSRAKAYIAAQEEDFGITTVESIASGRPVISYKKGGALEIVQEGVNGVFFDYQDWECLAEAVIYFNANDFDPYRVRQTVQKFSTQNFKKNMLDYLKKMHLG